MSQIDMFELLDAPSTTEQERDIVFELYNIVKVKKIHEDEIGKLDAEDYYYIKKFMNKKGKIVDVICNSINGTVSYKVEFDREVIGYFYEGDLVLP